MAKKIKNIQLGGVTYQLQDSELTALVNSLLAMTLPTSTQGETYWVPTTTDKTQWDNIKVLKFFNLKGSVASFADLPATAATGDVYLIANATSGFTEEWVKTDTSWELLGTVSGQVDISGKADKSEMVITDGTGANADKVTIQLKQGTTATVLKSHQDISGKADMSDVTALAGRVSTLENAEHPYLKQIANPDSYEGESGEIIQYKGATNDKYIRGFCYEKKAGETIVPSGLVEVTESSDTNVLPVGTKIIKYGEPHLVVISFEQEGDKFCFGEPHIGGTILYISGGEAGTITAVEEHGEDGYGRQEMFVTYYDDDIQGKNTVYLSVMNETADASNLQYSYITENGIKIVGYQDLLSDNGYPYTGWVLANETPVSLNGLDVLSLEGYEMPQLGTGGWQLIPNPQLKALFDGFTVTLISGTTDEYLLTIPQCDNGGSIVTNS